MSTLRTSDGKRDADHSASQSADLCISKAPVSIPFCQMATLNVYPGGIDQPRSGHYRLACAAPCEVLSFDGYRGRGTIWNLSVLGVYAVLPPPLPLVGRSVLLTFLLPGALTPVTGEARVEWHNAPSIFKGCGGSKPALPPGCGLSFRVLDAKDAARIAASVSAWARKRAIAP